jgi:NTP pyrophosphatase (non-canonical NTP hydrolase)
MTIDDFQKLIDKMYSDKDRARGAAGTFLWLSEEIGELAGAIAEGTHEEKEGEFADVLAWLVTLANIEGVDLTKAIRAKYGDGCPGCGLMVCTCDTKEIA